MQTQWVCTLWIDSPHAHFVVLIQTGFYCSPDHQKIHFGLTALVFVTGILAPWIEYKINGVEVRPFVLASLVFIGVVPFGHWLYITPDVYREEVTKVRMNESMNVYQCCNLVHCYLFCHLSTSRELWKVGCKLIYFDLSTGIYPDVCLVRHGIHAVCHQNARAILSKEVHTYPTFHCIFVRIHVSPFVLMCDTSTAYVYHYFLTQLSLCLFFFTSVFWRRKCLPRILCGTCVCSARCTFGSTFSFSTRPYWRATAAMRTNTALWPRAMLCVTPLPTAPARHFNESIKGHGYKSLFDFVLYSAPASWWVFLISPYFTTCLNPFTALNLS